MTRGFVAVVILPKFADVKVVVGLLRFVWLKALYIEVFNSTPYLSANLRFFWILRSMFTYPGPLSAFFPRVPNVPIAFCVNAAGLNQWAALSVLERLLMA